MAEGWIGLHEKNGATVFSCPAPHCYYHVLAPDEQSIEHTCPHSGPTSMGWSITMNMIQKMWVELDVRVDRLMEVPDRTDPALDKTKGEMRGIAIAIAIFTGPYHPDADSVVKEAMARYKLRQAGEEVLTHASDGTTFKNIDPDRWMPAKSGGYTNDPEHSIHGTSTRVANAPGTGAPPKADNFEAELEKRALRPQDITSIKNVRSMDLMPAHEVAAMYNISVGLVNYLSKM